MSETAHTQPQDAPRVVPESESRRRRRSPGRPKVFGQPMVEIRTSVPHSEFIEVEIAASEKSISIAQWVRDLIEMALETGWNAPPDGAHAYTIDGRRA